MVDKFWRWIERIAWKRSARRYRPMDPKAIKAEVARLHASARHHYLWRDEDYSI